MIDILKKELVIYTALLSMLILLMHPDLLSDPTTRLGLMQTQGNYIHPLLYTFIVYLILYFLRALVGFVIKFFNRKK